MPHLVHRYPRYGVHYAEAESSYKFDLATLIEARAVAVTPVDQPIQLVESIRLINGTLQLDPTSANQNSLGLLWDTSQGLKTVFINLSTTLFVLTGILLVVGGWYTVTGGDDQTASPTETEADFVPPCTPDPSELGFGAGAKTALPSAGSPDAALIREQIVAIKELTDAINKIVPVGAGADTLGLQ